jgi:hypothetical protein
MNAPSTLARRAQSGRCGAAAVAVAALFLLVGCSALAGMAGPPAAPASASAAATSGQESSNPPDVSDPPGATPADPTGDASCPADIVARICAEVNLTGATPVSGRGIVTAPEPPGSDPSTTCAAIASNTDGGNLGDHLDTVDGHQVAWDTSITDYHGPGSYRGSEFHLTIDDDAYSASAGGKVAITIGADFATTITMDNLVSSGNTPARMSGTIAWTCVDPTNGG